MILYVSIDKMPPAAWGLIQVVPSGLVTEFQGLLDVGQNLWREIGEPQTTSTARCTLLTITSFFTSPE